jgi:hypothetical protein
MSTPTEVKSLDNETMAPVDPVPETKGLEEDETTVDIVYTPDEVTEATGADGVVGVAGIVFRESSSLHKRHTLTSKQLHHSGVFMAALEDDKDTTCIPVPQSSMTEYAFDKCIEYLQHHRDDVIVQPEKPLKSKILSEVWSDPWDSTFIQQIYADKKKGEGLYEVILAANYLSIVDLIHLGCSQIAVLVKDEPWDKVDSILGLADKNDAKVVTAAV